MKKTLFIYFCVLAISEGVNAEEIEEKGMKFSASTALVHDDNIYRVLEDLAVSDNFLRANPEFNLVTGLGKHRFSVDYKAELAQFEKYDDANYNDHDLRAMLDFSHSTKLNSTIQAGFQDEHEEPGTINRIQLDMDEYNKFQQKFYSGDIAYGNTDSIGQFVLTYRHTVKDYKNNDLDFLNYDSNQYSLIFYYRLAPRTRAYIEATNANINYESIDGFYLDNEYKRYRAGISWDITEKLTGDINIGYQNRNYDLENLQDISGLVYDGQLTWDINTYTTIKTKARRESIDSSLEGVGGVLRNSYNIEVNHELTELWHVNFEAAYANDELLISNAREDKRNAYSVNIEYNLTRMIDVKTEFSHVKRESNLSLADFEANIISITLNLSLED